MDQPAGPDGGGGEGAAEGPQGERNRCLALREVDGEDPAPGGSGSVTVASAAGAAQVSPTSRVPLQRAKQWRSEARGSSGAGTAAR